jgi:hypothetical protein
MPLDAAIVGCSYYVLELNLSSSSKWAVLDWAAIEFSAGYKLLNFQEIGYCKPEVTSFPEYMV